MAAKTKSKIFYYSLNITGLPNEAKSFLMSRIENCHEYSWMLDEEDECGVHHISVRGDPKEIDSVLKDMLSTIDDTFMPQARAIDPDVITSWRARSVREILDEKYTTKEEING